MIEIQHLLPGTRIRIADGALAEIRENPRDGTWVIARRLWPQGDSSGGAAEPDDLVHVGDIAEVIAGRLDVARAPPALRKLTIARQEILCAG